MSGPAPVILPYAQDEELLRPRSVRRNLIWLIAMLPAAVAPFFTFTYSHSPIGVLASLLVDQLSEMALACVTASFFIVFPLIAWRMRLALGRRPGRLELAFAWALAFLCNTLPFTLLLLGFPELFSNERTRTAPMLFTLTAGMAGGTFVAIRCGYTPAAIDALMMGAYVANTSFCLTAFYDDPQIGYWITAVACASFFVQLLMLYSPHGRDSYVS